MADTVSPTSKRVLYADDDGTYRRTIPLILGRLGLKVKVVENGQLAVNAVNENSQYAFILLDNQMPVMGGLEAAKAILKKKTVTVILFTSDEWATVCNEVNTLGILYLQKPGSEQGFRKVLEGVDY